MAPETSSINFPALSPELLDRFRRAQRVLVLSHHNPDGDAIGSSVGLASALLAQGRRADLYLAGEWSDHLVFLLDGLFVKPDLTGLEQYDLVIVLDCHSFDRLGPEGPPLKAALAALPTPPPVVVVDHHLMGDNEIIEGDRLHLPGASSTGELAWCILKALNWNPPHSGLQGLLLALASDTGFFSQSNTTAGALAAAADLVALGGDLEEINRRIKQGLPLRKLKLMSLALSSLQLYFSGRLALMTITPDMLKAACAGMSDTEDFVELGRCLEGVSLSALIKDSGRGADQVKVSLRSRCEVDAAALARLFGGGGHRQAAAYNDPKAENAAEAKENLLAAAELFL